MRGQSRSLPPDKWWIRSAILRMPAITKSCFRESTWAATGATWAGASISWAMVERILRETSIARIRISSIEPMDVSPALIGLVAAEPRMAQHFHVPLQSGCDRILRLMNRRYWTRQYAERILAIHEQIPNAAIGADVMVGFPGETGQDHAASLRFIESLPSPICTSSRSPPVPARPHLPPRAQVNGRVARERSQEIRAVIDAKRQSFLAAQVGQSLPALTLDEVEDGARIALTTNYLKIALPAMDVPPNRLVDVQVGRAVSGKLIGYVRQPYNGSSNQR